MVLNKDWKKIEDNGIQKLEITINYQNFIEAVEAINKIKDIAEDLNHHPDLKIYSYNKLKIQVYTHDEKDITDKDYELASKIEKIL